MTDDFLYSSALFLAGLDLVGRFVLIDTQFVCILHEIHASHDMIDAHCDSLKAGVEMSGSLPNRRDMYRKTLDRTFTPWSSGRKDSSARHTTPRTSPHCPPRCLSLIHI